MKAEKIKKIVVLAIVFGFLGAFVCGINYLILESLTSTIDYRITLPQQFVQNLPDKKTIIKITKLRFKRDKKEIKGIVIAVRFFGIEKEMVYFKDGKKQTFRNPNKIQWQLGRYYLIEAIGENIKSVRILS